MRKGILLALGKYQRPCVCVYVCVCVCERERERERERGREREEEREVAQILLDINFFPFEVNW